MDQLSSCYFCGTALEDPLGTYKLGTDGGPRITLCDACLTKLETVFERLDVPGPAPVDGQQRGLGETGASERKNHGHVPSDHETGQRSVEEGGNEGAATREQADPDATGAAVDVSRGSVADGNDGEDVDEVGAHGVEEVTVEGDLDKASNDGAEETLAEVEDEGEVDDQDERGDDDERGERDKLGDHGEVSDVDEEADDIGTIDLAGEVEDEGSVDEELEDLRSQMEPSVPSAFQAGTSLGKGEGDSDSATDGDSTATGNLAVGGAAGADADDVLEDWDSLDGDEAVGEEVFDDEAFTESDGQDEDGRGGDGVDEDGVDEAVEDAADSGDGGENSTIAGNLDPDILEDLDDEEGSAASDDETAALREQMQADPAEIFADAEAADAAAPEPAGNDDDTEEQGGKDATALDEQVTGEQDGQHAVKQDGHNSETMDEADATPDPAADTEKDSSETRRRSISALEYNKVMRLLQNREFPVERETIEAAASESLDLSGADCAAVIDLAVEQGLLEESGGELLRPE